MKKEHDITPFIITSGLFILVVFTSIITLNLLPNHESDSYYAKTDKDLNIKVESFSIKDGKLVFTTSGNPKSFCLKTTRSIPEKDSLCFKKMSNNKAEINILINKKYYLWLQDENGNISNYEVINGDK